MSAQANTSSGGNKTLLSVLGVLVILAAIGWMGYVGKTVLWPMWQTSHPPKVAVPAPNPALPKGIVPPKGPAVAPPKPPTMGELLAKTDRLTLVGKVFGGVIGLLVGVRLLQTGLKKETPSAISTVVAHSFPQTKTTRRAAKRWNACNILQVNPDSRHLWNFSSGKNGFTPNTEQTLSPGEKLPATLVARDWKTLLQPRLNIAWLPVEQVFLRVAQLPVGPFEETLSMVELQLEKLSPLPVTQIVWTVQVMPQHADNLQTVVVTMMARDLVEKFLGELESKGFLADRLELPALDQLLATPIAEDGAYIYPYSGSEKFTALVAWWQAGVLRSVGLVHVPTADSNDAILKEQLAQMAWSGELEGWLKGDPRWHLVADETVAANWQPLFQPWLGHSATLLAPLTGTQLAVANANRAARSETESGMLPVEYAKRYTQEFHDRLWMRALAAALVIYLAGVTIYMAASAWRGMTAETLEQRTASLSRTYTNTLQLKAQLEILQNRQALKFASLDCWMKTAELLPEGITVQSLEFKDGKDYNLSGVAPSDMSGKLTDFNEALRKATLHDQPMFESMTVPSIRLNPGGTTVTWSFAGVLARVEASK